VISTNIFTGTFNVLTKITPLSTFEGNCQRCERIVWRSGPEANGGNQPAGRSRLVVELVLPVLDDGEGRRGCGTGSAHDEPLAVLCHVELKITGGSELRRAGDAEERLGLADLQWRFYPPVCRDRLQAWRYNLALCHAKNMRVLIKSGEKRFASKARFSCLAISRHLIKLLRSVKLPLGKEQMLRNSWCITRRLATSAKARGGRHGKSIGDQ
jgi:hypothetical protein